LGPLAPRWARRALREVRCTGGLDAVCILGDLIGDARGPDAQETQDDLLDQIRIGRRESPLWLVRGNHDLPPERIEPIGRAGLRIYRLGCLAAACFDDVWDDRGVCTRPGEQLEQLENFARGHAGPLLALQHNPIHPVIEADYPYMPANREQIMACYERSGVSLSLSGHYHRGREPVEHNGVTYVTLGALCEGPYPYGLVAMEGDRLTMQFETLGLPRGLVDSHVHTPLAYCAAGIRVSDALADAGRIGLSGLVFAEHAPQLYCAKEDFWQGSHVENPSLWRSGLVNRMQEYRSLVEPLVSPRVSVGLEVELDAEGSLTLREEDRHWPDVLLGALHWVPGSCGDSTRRQEARRFLQACQRICACGIDVLAHPLRWLTARENPGLADVFEPLAGILASASVSAELNFHKAPVPEAFVEACLKAGVKFALGSDAHAPHRVGLLGPQVSLLRRVLGREDISEVLGLGGSGQAGRRGLR
jgi:histidinol phosphatase-like PHP family hydrolase